MTPATTRLGFAAAMIVVFGALSAAPAAAHTELEKSTPAEGSTVRQVGKVTLVFSGAVSLARVTVHNAAGTQFQSGSARVRGHTVTQRVSGRQPAGRYTIAYRVVAADGHRVAGTVSVRVAGASAGGIEGTEAGSKQAPPSPKTQARSEQRQTAAETSDGGRKWLMAGGGLLLVLGIGGGIVVLRRGKETRSSGD
ncbi:MAG TPA: copper resistance CopC family protein [Streptosporangiaceae bacterium]|jgi:hypothetical protein